MILKEVIVGLGYSRNVSVGSGFSVKYQRATVYVSHLTKDKRLIWRATQNRTPWRRGAGILKKEARELAKQSGAQAICFRALHNKPMGYEKDLLLEKMDGQ